MFEDSAHEDHRDEIPVYVESSGSSDKGGVATSRSTAMDEFDPHSGDKRKAAGKRSKEKEEEKIAAKIDHFIEATVSDSKTYMSELLATGRLQKQTDMYFYTCKFLS
ncbi:Hypothetical predicted protein [Olea europaea subsp. europaea]|uniref:Uncharacterized protein n=1 Tax=Olea europaea subsp. europaea TaxID=158383 RepID=A0A8S0P9E4_OLEEU|nr:Hypothetical predicted protein [Olea europaea subsp. europaea]